jgi:hypothetical protein
MQATLIAVVLTTFAVLGASGACLTVGKSTRRAGTAAVDSNQLTGQGAFRPGKHLNDGADRVQLV